MTNNFTVSEKQTADVLAAHADAIRDAGRRTVKAVIEIGYHLTEAQKTIQPRQLAALVSARVRIVSPGPSPSRDIVTDRRNFPKKLSRSRNGC
jgi:hypothetical protein